MKLQHKPVDTSGRNWLLPFNDMMTLMLTFFVLLLAISKVDAEKVRTASFAVSDYLGIAAEPERSTVRVFDPFVFSSSDDADKSSGQVERMESRPWGTKDDRERFIRTLNAMTGVKAKMTENGIETNFSEHLFFRSGQMELAFTDHPGLQEILEVLKRTDATIRVEDHTIDQPVDQGHDASNWELSTARAARLAGALITRGVAPWRLSVSGCGDMGISVAERKEKTGKVNRIDFILTFNRN